MIRRCLAYALGLFAWALASSSSAQPLSNPCNETPPPTVPTYSDIAFPPGFACMPREFGGPGTALQIRTNAAGATVWWHCPLAKSPTDPTIVGWATVQSAGTWARILAGSFRVDTRMDDPALTPVWCPTWREVAASRPAVATSAPAPTPSWKTASILSYNAAGGALTGLAGQITRGLACDCSAPLRVGASTYCPFTGAPRPTVVALCTKQ